MLEHFEWYDVVRVLTAVLCLISMYYLGLRVKNRRRAFSPTEIDLWWGLNAALLVFFVSSIENIVQNNGFGARVVLTFIASVVLLKGSRGLYHTPEPLPRKGPA